MIEITREKNFRFGPERICLEYYITHKCNFKCSYCYMQEDMKNSEDFDYNKFEKFKTFISKQKEDITLIILGGEPLTIKQIPEITNEIFKLKPIKHIEIGTNGSLLKNFHNLGLTFFCSMHREYLNRVDDLIKGIKQNRNSTFIFNILLGYNEPLEQYKSIINKIIREIGGYDEGIIFTFNVLVKSKNNENYSIMDKIKYLTDYDFNLYFNVKIKDQTYKINNNEIAEFFRMVDTRFKGCLCKIDTYYLAYNGDLRFSCSPPTDIITNVYNDPSFIMEHKKVLCPYGMCDISGFLNSKKINNSKLENIIKSYKTPI